MQRLAAPAALTRAALSAAHARGAERVRASSGSSLDRPSQSDAHLSEQPGTYEKVDIPQVLIVRKKGHDVISDPLYNKGASTPGSTGSV
jgi:hypothetical protein